MTAVTTSVFLLSHGFQSEYEVGFANGLAQYDDLDVHLIGSDLTLAARLSGKVRFRNWRGSQSVDRSVLAKVVNLGGYWLRYLTAAVLNRRAIFHFNGLFSLRGDYGVLAEAFLARCFIRHWVLSVHNLLPHDSHTERSRRVYERIYRWPERLVVHTEQMRAALVADWGIPADRIVVVEHGIDRFHVASAQERSVARKTFGLADDAKVALFFGRVVRYKGLQDLLATLACDVPAPMTLLVAGQCRDEGLREELSRLARQLPPTVTLVWIDRFIEHDEVDALFASADVNVMPYLHIDQSGVIFMAMSQGVPTVATDVGSLAHYVDYSGGAIGALRPGASFVDAMARCMGSATLEGRAANAARAQAAFAWSRVLAPLRDQYKQLDIAGSFNGIA